MKPENKKKQLKETQSFSSQSIGVFSISFYIVFISSSLFTPYIWSIACLKLSMSTNTVKSADDWCYFSFNSTCTKGDACPFQLIAVTIIDNHHISFEIQRFYDQNESNWYLNDWIN